MSLFGKKKTAKKRGRGNWGRMCCGPETREKLGGRREVILACCGIGREYAGRPSEHENSASRGQGGRGCELSYPTSKRQRKWGRGGGSKGMTDSARKNKRGIL